MAHPSSLTSSVPSAPSGSSATARMWQQLNLTCLIRTTIDKNHRVDTGYNQSASLGDMSGFSEASIEWKLANLLNT